jgi:hypothetical protein
MEDIELLFKISKLIAREKAGVISDEEKWFLNNWISRSEKNRKIYESILNSTETGNESYDSGKAFKKVLKTLRNEGKTGYIFYLPSIYKYAAAAIFIGLMASYFIFFSNDNEGSLQYAARNIKPGTNKAILITKDKKIELGSTKNKSVYLIDNATVTDTNSVLAYKSEASIIEEKNTLETPKGGEYTLILSDGSKVIMNSASKLEFPVVFNKKTREVTLSGEAYFEVTKSTVPFIIHIGNTFVTVYGTSFNISAYEDDNLLQTTLVEGKVGFSVMQGKEPLEYKINPGQQTSFNKQLNNVDTKNVDTEIYTSWIKGVFRFENESIEKILKRLSRWYNIEIEYADVNIKNENFTGDLNLKRYDNISKILEMISLASDIEFKINNHKLIVNYKKE